LSRLSIDYSRHSIESLKSLCFLPGGDNFRIKPLKTKGRRIILALMEEIMKMGI
jgi:hypothetical protein